MGGRDSPASGGANLGAVRIGCQISRGCLLDPRSRYPDKISHRGIFLKSIALKLPEDLLDESARLAGTLHLSRAEYIRVAIRRMNRKTAARLRAEKLAELSKMVRGESMRVNAEFAAIEREPNV